MTKKQTDSTPVMEDTLPSTAVPTAEHTDHWTRQTAVQYAIDHHRINGGMLTVPQLIDNAKQFHAYITGETK